MMHTSQITNIATRLSELAVSEGSREALIELTPGGGAPRVVSYSDLDHFVSSCAAGMLKHGIKRDSRVVLFVPMSVDLYVLMLALFRIGAVAVFIDPWSGRDAIEAAAKQVHADAFIGVPKAHALRVASRTIRRIPIQVIAGWGARHRIPARLTGSVLLQDMLAARPGVEHSCEVAAADPALVTFTGGSTGRPKGADRTHGFLAAQQETLTRNIELDATDRCLTNLPIVVLHGLERGVTVVMPPPGMAQNPDIDGAVLAAMIERHAVDVLALSPAPLEQLAQAARHQPIVRVRRVYTGGGPVLPHTLTDARAALPHARIVTIYGSTEAEPIAHAPASESLARRNVQQHHGGVWVGFPVPDITARVITPHPEAITVTPGSSLRDWYVPDGDAGELIVTGPHVNERYVGNPEATQAHKVFDEDGRCWHRTGDIVRADTDGSLWLLGRLEHRVVINGQAYWPLEIEIPLMERPEISRAAVVHGTTPVDTSAPIIAVESTPGTTDEAARAAAIDTLRARELHEAITVRVLHRIPMDPRHGAKVDQTALQRMINA